MERWSRGVLLTLFLTAMVLSNKFISLGSIHMFLCLGEIIFLVFAVVKLSGYTRGELGLGGEFHPIKHILFPFVFFIFPLVVVAFVPHNAMPPWKFLLYFLNYLIIAGLIEELLFRGLLFASLEERFGGWAALFGNSVIHWLAHFAVGLNISQLIAALILSSYRLAFRRIEPLILVHGLWDAVFIALNPKLLGWWGIVIMFPLVGALFSILVYDVSRISKAGHS
ncbi:CPBP family intramembrane glutamic endopeptidase [Thermococcus sp. Bubb.Bath]|uniref:CPBP family intramembrane glutamic endopeptidase n=1 Tax=Thermococcus sp. Bubb.Bath TaxID=1638242 RepID=UPI00143CAF8B|nr:CPBP family intramembrane glutamic endopeptidase [Thermococcus sp. Bubb.Bath]NJF25019.1 CPBP family intramembrane metalloprotease [Thermococcus sp. Bubb.Bath]